MSESQPTHDLYGYPVKSMVRHHNCQCPVPCQERYVCEGCHQRQPYCFGAADRFGSFCDDCVYSGDDPITIPVPT